MEEAQGAMQVTETLSEGLKRQYKVVIGAEEISGKVQGKLDEIRAEARLPGFRPGKAPPALIRKRFGASVLSEVLQSALNDASQQALEERNLKPAMQPKIDIHTTIDESYIENVKDLEYDLNVELLPEIEPIDFSTVSLERLDVEVPEEEVQGALDRMAAQQRKTEPLAEPRPAANGDVVVIDFEGLVDGKPFKGLSAEDHHLELGGGEFVEGFADQLVGVQKGDEREGTVTLPENLGNPALAGKQAVFKVTVKDVLQVVPVPLDDESAKNFGAENLEDLKAKVREAIAGEYARGSRSLIKRQLLDKLAEGHSFPVPPGMVDMEFEAIWRRIEQDKAAGRLDEEDAGKDEETLKAEYRTIAERRVRLGLLLADVGQRNSVEVTNEELQQALGQEMRNYPGREQDVLDFYRKTPEALTNLRGPIFEEKVVDLIISQAQVSPRTVSPEELKQAIDGLDEEKGASAEAEPAAS